MKKYLIFISIVVCSCSKYPENVENALEIAGDNRSELEKVINHFQDTEDSLKLESAYYLIATITPSQK